MAGRIWTKGVAWKKTAIKLLADNSHSGLIPAREYGDRGFSTLQEFPSLLTSSHRKKSGLWSVNRWMTSSSHPLSTNRNGNSVNTLELEQKCQNSLLKALSNFSLKGEQFSSHNLSRTNIFGKSEKRNFSTSTDNGPNTEAPKVGIISTMFNEEPKVIEQAAKDDTGSHDDKQEKKDEKTESPFLRSQRIAKWMLIATFSVGTPLLIYEFGPPKRDEYGNEIEDEFSHHPIVVSYIKRAWGEIRLMEKDIVEPSSQKLLPDGLQPPYHQPPYTVVIELFDVLLHPVYDQIHGWRFKKRPGIDFFLEQVGPPLYEIVIFTRETGMTAHHLVDSMDPKGYIMYRLFRDAARFKSGFKMGNILKGEFPKLDSYYQKDITYLNRDLKRVVVVDNDKRATELQPSNGVCLKPWDGSSTDTELFDLAAFLSMIATNEVDDVRPVLEHYRSYEDPLAAFKLAQARIHEEQQRMAKELQEKKGKSFLLNSSGGNGGFSMLTNYFRARN